MEALNQSLFLLINAPANPDALTLLMARLLADYAIWLIPVGLMLGWLRSGNSIRKTLLLATLTALLGLLLNQAIGLVWHHPRPFMIGLGHTFSQHAAESSFPSDHLTLLWSVAFILLGHRATRATGVALSLLGLPIAWARIYLGVHFPLDMIGAVLVAGLSAGLCTHLTGSLINAIQVRAATPYRYLFAPLIRRGWVRP